MDLRATTPLGAGQVDDTPYGGGAGMVIRVDVVEAALRGPLRRRPAGAAARRRVVALSAGGRQFDDALATELAGAEELTLLCGRYEGFDERVHEHLATDVVSIGPYVLAGGELAAMVVSDAVMRKLPGALGHEDSALEESFSRGARGRARSTPLHASRWTGAGTRCPRSCCRATTPACANGGSSRAASAPTAAALARLAGFARRASATIRATRAHAVPRSRFFPCQASSTASSARSCAVCPSFQAGDRVRVHFQVVEGTRRRTQVFEGVVIKRQGSGARETFTVRKQSFGVGVERTFPVHSPKIERIEVAARGDVRRAKLYYLRDRVGRGARVRERRWGREEPEPGLRGRRDAARTTPAPAARRRAARRRWRADAEARRPRRRGRAEETPAEEPGPRGRAAEDAPAEAPAEARP